MTTIELVYPHLPPAFDAIGEHTLLLGEGLSRRGCDVRICAIGGPKSGPLPIRNLPGRLPRAMRSLDEVAAERAPDWVVIQYNPFSYGRWGINPWLVSATRRLRRASGRPGVILHVHETFVPRGRVKTTVLSGIQATQLRALGEAADVVLFTVEAWAERFRPWFRQAIVDVIPLGSNLPDPPDEPAQRRRAALRHSWGVDDDTVVVGMFGGLGPHRGDDLVHAAVSGLDPKRTHFVHVGPNVQRSAQLLAATNVPWTGLELPEAREAAGAVEAFDIALAPFRNGVSGRRGSFLASLQQAVATVTTGGELTGPSMQEAAHSGCFRLTTATPEDFRRVVGKLSEEAQERGTVARNGQAFYRRNHDWSVVTERLLTSVGVLNRVRSLGSGDDL